MSDTPHAAPIEATPPPDKPLITTTDGLEFEQILGHGIRGEVTDVIADGLIDTMKRVYDDPDHRETMEKVTSSILDRAFEGFEGRDPSGEAVEMPESAFATAIQLNLGPAIIHQCVNLLENINPEQLKLLEAIPLEERDSRILKMALAGAFDSIRNQSVNTNEANITVEHDDHPHKNDDVPTQTEIENALESFLPHEQQQIRSMGPEKSGAILAQRALEMREEAKTRFSKAWGRAKNAYAKVKKSAQRNPRFKDGQELEIPDNLVQQFCTVYLEMEPDEVVGYDQLTEGQQEEFLGILYESLVPNSEGYIPTRRELTRLKNRIATPGEVQETDEFNAAVKFVQAKIAKDINKMFPNGIEFKESEDNEAMIKIISQTTGNGDDTTGRILFAQKRVDPTSGEIEYFWPDKDGQAGGKLTPLEISTRKKRLHEIKLGLTVSEIGAWAHYEISKLQEDQQEDGWNTLLNVMMDVGLDDSEIMGVYTAIKFRNKGQQLAKKYRSPKKFVTEAGNYYWAIGPMDKVGYVVEAAEKFPKHGYQWSTNDVLYQKREVESSIQTATKYMFAREATEPERTTVGINTFGHEKFYEVMDYGDTKPEITTPDKVIEEYAKSGEVISQSEAEQIVAKRREAAQYLEWGESLFFLMHMKSMVESTKMGPSAGEAEDDKMAAMQQQADAERRATMGAAYPPQIPGSDQANKIWRQIDELLTQFDRIMPGLITRNTAEHFPEQVFEALDGYRWTNGTFTSSTHPEVFDDAVLPADGREVRRQRGARKSDGSRTPRGRSRRRRRGYGERP